MAVKELLLAPEPDQLHYFLTFSSAAVTVRSVMTAMQQWKTQQRVVTVGSTASHGSSAMSEAGDQLEVLCTCHSQYERVACVLDSFVRITSLLWTAPDSVIVQNHGIMAMTGKACHEPTPGSRACPLSASAQLDNELIL